VEGDDAVPSQVQIQCECAFTYQNALFQKNLTDARVVNPNDVDTASDIGGGAQRWQGQSAVLPDKSDMHLGRERPPIFRAPNLGRRVAEAVAHAPDASVTATDSRAGHDVRGKHRRAL